jgi:hypothetical protein
MSNQQRTPVQISTTRAIYNWRSFYKDGNFYIWFWVEFSKAKTKRRNRNKQARKQRKLNNKNHGKN